MLQRGSQTTGVAGSRSEPLRSELDFLAAAKREYDYSGERRDDSEPLGAGLTFLLCHALCGSAKSQAFLRRRYFPSLVETTAMPSSGM